MRAKLNDIMFCTFHRLRQYIAAASICLAISFPLHATEATHNNIESEDYVSQIMPYPITLLHDRIALLFDSNARDYYDDYPSAIYDLPHEARGVWELAPAEYKKFLSNPLVKQSKFYVFYGAYPTMQSFLAKFDTLAAMGHENAGLQRYAALPVSERVNDFYIWSPDTPFWHSEYTTPRGKALPFRSYFIIHLNKVDDSHTAVEIIENEPVVTLRGNMNVDANGVVHNDELREVEPTNHEREFMLSCISQFIERNRPGRHWFSCREKGEIVPEIIPWTVP